MNRLISVTLVLVLLPLQVAADETIAPAWYLEEIALLTAGTGRWVTDNARYRSDEEPFDAYVTEWVAGFGGTTMTGRLYGMQDGEASVDFWEFRQYWHPGLQQVVVEQYGWGSRVGLGTAWREGNVTHSRQTFYAADGSSSEQGHRSYFPDTDTHVTNSFDINDDEWKPRRTYTWRRSDSQD